jgi:hypothetical protein
LFEAKQQTNLSSVIDYFSAPNLLDIFNLGGDFSYDNSQFQLAINNSILLTDANVYDIQS